MTIPKEVRKRLNLPRVPPISHRYCLYCKKVTKFVYNRNIFHSCCVVCGSHFSKKPRQEEPQETKP